MRRNSDQDKLDSTYIEYDIFSLWKIDIVGLIKTKATLSKNFHIQPSEIDKMQFWEYEMFLDALSNLIKEENKDQEEQMKQYKVPKVPDYKNLNNYIPKIPNISSSNFKLPNI